MEKRKGEVVAARLLLRRGEQQIAANRPTEAIRSTGRGLVKLFKNESRNELVVALYLLSVSYERLGLSWAARGMLLAAASIAAQDFKIHGEVTVSQAACFNRLKWLELLLGRVPQALAWHELDIATRTALAIQGHQSADLDEGEESFDPILGILFLRSRLTQLQGLGRLVSALERLNLNASAVALTFALGHVEKLPAELGVDLSDPKALNDFFVLWRDQPAASDLHFEPSFGETDEAKLTSNILGCKFTVDAENTPACLTTAESILATIESLLATGVVDRLISLEPAVTIMVREVEHGEALFDFKLTEQGGLPHVTATCAPFNPNQLVGNDQQALKSKISELLVTLLGRLFPITNLENLAARLFGEDRALERSVNFGCSYVVVGNVLGDPPRTDLKSWLDLACDELQLVRSAEWDFDARPSAESAEVQPRMPITIGKGPPPEEIRDASATKHSQVRTVSLIRSSLWDQAKWCGMAFVRTGRPADPPMMALLFENEASASEIFSHLRDEIGARDLEDRIRVTIIRGIDAANPHSYRVLIGTNVASIPSGDLSLVAIGCRVHTMTPPSSNNLDDFLQNFRTSGFYALSYAIKNEELWQPRFNLIIGKRELYVREAWEIGRHDFDSPGVKSHDDPIIPTAQVDAPVIDLLAWKRQAGE
jgi:hypothetical protein